MREISSEAITDIVVVGGGVIGSSIAYHLARAGARVRVFEQATPGVAPSASWASAGGVRQQGRDPREWLLTLEAGRRWPALADELGMPTGFVQGGHLHVVESEADLDALRERVAREQAAGMNVRMVDTPAIRDLAPALSESALAGAYTPDDGQANPPMTTRAFAAAAQRHGAVYSTRTRVVSLQRERGRITGVTTDTGTFSAEQTVLAAGAWTSRLAASVGLRLPIQVRGPQMLLTTPAPAMLAPTVTASGRALSLKQLPSGEYFIGGGWPSDVLEDAEGVACRVRQESVAGSWAVATAVVPAVGSTSIAQSWCGVEAEAVDGVPLIGPAPGYEGLYLAVGFSGHGFQISPAVGRAVADALAGKATLELEELSPGRDSLAATYSPRVQGGMAPLEFP
ncbi:MAG: FAD-binding oxidoreductase [Chloroflexi bacterium]|nr:FAD-binding oxidoreductase [Chloroflexota bacterium]